MGREVVGPDLGQSTAVALTSLATFENTSQVTGDSNQTSTSTTQTPPPTLTTFVPISTNFTTLAELASVTSGYAYFSQYDVPIYNTSAGVTSLQTVGSYSVNLYIDFGMRIVSGSANIVEVDIAESQAIAQDMKIAPTDF